MQVTQIAAIPLFYNLHWNVGNFIGTRGARCPNRPDDVALVAWLLSVWGAGIPSADVQKAAVVATAQNLPALQALIDLIQKELHRTAPATTVDGHLSPAVNNVSYSHRQAGFMICQANSFAARKYSDVWPRLDKIPGCPADLVSMANAACVPRGQLPAA